MTKKEKKEELKAIKRKQREDEDNDSDGDVHKSSKKKKKKKKQSKLGHDRFGVILPFQPINFNEYHAFASQLYSFPLSDDVKQLRKQACCNIRDPATSPTPNPLPREISDIRPASLPPSVIALLSSLPFSTLSPVQRSFIPLSLSRSSCSRYLVNAPTGTGKTMAYLVPLLSSRDAMSSLVIVPTRELCNQVVSMARAITKKARIAKAVGGEDREEQVERFESRRVDLVVGTPGRVKDLMSMPVCANFMSRTGVLVLDEVDVLCTKNFRDDIGEVAGMLGGRGLWGFSATAGKGVRDVIGEGAVFLKCASEGQGGEERKERTEKKEKKVKVDKLDKEGGGGGGGGTAEANVAPAEANVASAEANVASAASETSAAPALASASVPDEPLPLPTLPPTITQILHVTSSHKRQKKLLHILPKILDGSGLRRKPQCMVFFSTIRELKEASRFLAKSGPEAGVPSHAPLHGDIRQEIRTTTLNNFRAGKFQLLLCTDVAGRGVDVKGLKYVVLYDFPTNLETWVHRSGRVGRGGNGKKGVEGVVYSFFERKWRKMAEDVKTMLEGAGQWIDPNLKDLVEGKKGKKEKKEKKEKGGGEDGEGVGKGKGKVRENKKEKEEELPKGIVKSREEIAEDIAEDSKMDDEEFGAMLRPKIKFKRANVAELSDSDDDDDDDDDDDE
ncbi:hypothetical protein TrRE_jg9365 [Triparma retinervis]|uniref:ATP-dependent RNA helicase n=1 Tax=Triparma retinervis TaxID=2557542 RepID=A0A9W7E066_9STRA|nr:hypothetical protein TrRE_jg9365 [Triparma retinervis]